MSYWCDDAALNREQARLDAEQRAAERKIAAREIWESWFAWYPVRTFDGWRWLTTVSRRSCDNGSRCSELHRSWWEYRV